jgi:osmotically-inducible protein OsmY
MQQIPDETLRQRVRAQLGHVVSHPGSIEVEVGNHIVNIRGPVLRGERWKIEQRLAKTRGVKECRIEVTEHEPGTNIPGLQGQSRTRRAG